MADCHFLARFGSPGFHAHVLGWVRGHGKETGVREFIPFDDRCFDEDPPGPLVPLPGNYACVRCDDGVFHWLPAGTSEKVSVSPSRTPSFAAVPALSSST